jgi:hypothetical protein
MIAAAKRIKKTFQTLEPQEIESLLRDLNNCNSVTELSDEDENAWDEELLQ